MTSRPGSGIAGWPATLRLRGRELVASTYKGAGLLLANYYYSFTPAQLAELSRLADETAGVGGAFVEIGVGFGYTSVWLNRHLAARGRQPKYVAIDTFEGFTAADVAVERARGKGDSYDDFSFNSQKLYALTMKRNGFRNVTIVEADAATYDYRDVAEVAFALIDVDLYRPMSAAIGAIWAQLMPGGVIVCDDCNPEPNKWDGARQAYEEFCQANDIPLHVVETKLGIIRKPMVVSSG
jgi:predicted O-methyltransferase YrrM